MVRTVILVCGPPCAGKTTYVATHAQPGDLVLDQDQLGVRGMNARLSQVRAMTTGTAWVIRCAAGQSRRQTLASQLAATDTVLLVPPLEVLLHRAKTRPNRRRTMQSIRKWMTYEATDMLEPASLPTSRRW